MTGRRNYDGAKLITSWWGIVWPIAVIIITAAFTWGTTTAAISKVQGEVSENKKEVLDLKADIKAKAELRDRDVVEIKQGIAWIKGKLGYPEQ